MPVVNGLKDWSVISRNHSDAVYSPLQAALGLSELVIANWVGEGDSWWTVSSFSSLVNVRSGLGWALVRASDTLENNVLKKLLILRRSESTIGPAHKANDILLAVDTIVVISDSARLAWCGDRDVVHNLIGSCNDRVHRGEVLLLWPVAIGLDLALLEVALGAEVLLAAWGCDSECSESESCEDGGLHGCCLGSFVAGTIECLDRIVRS